LLVTAPSIDPAQLTPNGNNLQNRWPIGHFSAEYFPENFPQLAGANIKGGPRSERGGGGGVENEMLPPARMYRAHRLSAVVAGDDQGPVRAPFLGPDSAFLARDLRMTIKRGSLLPYEH
jgi:hypothetical protein